MTRISRRMHLLTAVATAGIALALAATASALPPPNPDGDPPIKLQPNLAVASSVTAPFGTNDWELRYTVTNRGNAAATRVFRVDTQTGSTLLRSTSYAGLDAGASRTETFRIPRGDCYIPVRFRADAGGAVVESNEYDNDRWAVGLSSFSCPTQPKYAVKAVSFHAYDETGIDWLGSDEPYWIFSSEGMPGTARTTASHVFGDIDTGDTASFGTTEGCLYLSCSGGAAPRGIGFSIQGWEEDLGYRNQTLTDVSIAFHDLGGITEGGAFAWVGTASNKVGDALDYLNSIAADDLLGSQTYAYDPVYLASRLPSVGSSFTDVRSFSDSGNYALTTVVTRVG